MCGSVSYNYNIGKYEVTAKQYTDFLNHKATSDGDPYGLYNDPYMNWGYIHRSGSGTVADPYSYSVASEWANRPVNYVSYWNACRFANWLSNGQGNGDTETGSYTLNGYNGSDGCTIQRNPGVTWAVTSEDEWYKAAYYKGGGTNAGYWDYPMQSDIPTTPSNDITNPDGGNNACFYQDGFSDNIYSRTNVGEFENSESAYGTFDQGGNVFEWNESLAINANGAYRAYRGSSYGNYEHFLQARDRIASLLPLYGQMDVGFRVSEVPGLAPPLALETVAVGDAGNVGELSGTGAGGSGSDRICGSVAYNYNIGKYEVTANQYTDFLNNKATSNGDPYGLYDTSMTNNCHIVRSGSGTAPDPYSYIVASDSWDRPVINVSYWDACRFANWLSNGKGNGDTENGAYTLDGYNGQDGNTIGRNPGAKWAVTSEDEWYKAAYYKGGGTNAGYWDYPMQSDIPTTPSNDFTYPDGGNNASFYQDGFTIGSPYARTNAGEFENSESAYGTFDQGGNVFEWNETIAMINANGAYRGNRGGSFGNYVHFLQAWTRVLSVLPLNGGFDCGFRVSEVFPEFDLPPTIISLTPNSGNIATGIKQTFASVYSDPDGFANLKLCYLLINTTLSGTNAVYVMYDANANLLYLRTDANTSWGTGYALGSATVLQNSQCKLYCAETTKSGSGNNLTVNWKIEFKPAMFGKTFKAWMSAGDDQNHASTWVVKGNFRFTLPPTIISLAPATGKLVPSTKRTFTSVYSDPDGYTDLSQCNLLFNTTISGSSAAYLMYDQIANKLYLRNDTNSVWLGGYAPGSANSIENAQCKLYCAETTKSGLGNNLTVNWMIEFKQPFADKFTTTTTMKAWMYVVDEEKLAYGWTLKGNYKWLYPKSLTPSSAKLVPGVKQTLASVYRDDDGYADISKCYALFNSTVTSNNGANVMYDAVANKLYLWNDATASWGTGYAPGSANNIENSYCKIYCAETTKSVSGNLMTINWKIEFKQPMADRVAPGTTLKAWTYVLDKKSQASGWLLRGEYTWMCPTSLTPSSGKLVVGSKKTFTSVYRDGDGYADISKCYTLFNTTITSKNGANVMYDAVANKLYLWNDATASWGTGYAPGSANNIENNYCKIYCAETTKSVSGNLMTINWKIEFKQPMADRVTPGTTLKAWAYMLDKKNQASGWLLRGEYTWMCPTSLTPSSGKLVVGEKKTFTTIFRDDDGYSDISRCQLMLDTTGSGTNAVCLMYDSVANKLYLRNNASTAWLGGYAPGSANIIENSQCKLYCAETTKSGTSNLLTINWRLEFKQAMEDKAPIGPSLNAWMYIVDKKSLASGWVPKSEFRFSAYSGQMIYISAGSFLMGGPVQSASPQHSVYLSAYYIGKYEVTRGEYRAFMNAGGYSTQSYWSGDGWSWRVSHSSRTEPDYWAANQDWGTGTFTQTDNHPVLGMTYYEAEAFCNWAGGHVPTEAQWEKAARWTGTHANVYPWLAENTWNWANYPDVNRDFEKCNNWWDNNSAGGGACKWQTAPVGSYPSGASPYGCQDMAGNVREWCQDWYSPSYYSQTPSGGWIDPTGPTSILSNYFRVSRGGDCTDGNNIVDTAQCAYRADWYMGYPGDSWKTKGFRLAR